MRLRYLLLAACTSTGCLVETGAPEKLRQSSQAITGAQVLDFESTSPWSPGGTTLALSTTVKSQGAASMRVTTPTNWHQITAANLSSVGTVGDKLGLDLRIDRPHAWGTLRAVVSIPSQQEWNTTVGEVSLASKPVNQFFRVEFPISEHLRNKLSAYYNDLELSFVLSAPPAVYHFDNGTFASVPGPLTFSHIGQPGKPGSYSTVGSSYVIQSAGNDVEFNADNFHFLYRSLNGDGQVVVKLNSFSAPQSWAKVGLMIRDSITPGSKNAFMLLRPQLGSAFQYRSSNGGGTFSSWQEQPGHGSAEHKVRWYKLPKWLKLTRQGNVIRAYASNDGSCWGSKIWEQTLAFDDSLAFFGVAVSSDNSASQVSANVSNFSVQGTIDPINASCDRAAKDGEPPWSPIASDWLVPPGRFGTSTWNYTTTNPNGSITPVKCDPNEQDTPPSAGDPEGRVAPRKDGPDHPNCPEPGVVPPWTALNFGHNTPGWQFSKPAGFGPTPVRPGDKVSTPLSSRGLWLRKTFTLSSQAQKDGLVLWGRWAAGMTVYINGVLATSAHDTSDEHRYIGLSNAARSALVVGGTNVIAVRLEWERRQWVNNQITEFDAWERFFDLGIAVDPRLVNLPLDPPSQAGPLAAYTEAFRDFMRELAISGGTIAIRKDGQTVVKSGIGWRDKNLTQAMPSNAVMRLASNDKVITGAAIVKLIRDGVLQPDMPVFPYLNLAPVPGQGAGAGVSAITVEQLRTHTSGIGDAPGGDQAALDEMAFKFGIPSNQWSKHHLARWLYSQNVSGAGDESYSSAGYALLRYLIERATNKPLNQYLAQDMGLSEIFVSSERLSGRQSSEPGYITYEEPWDRWLGLEDYLALSASAEGMAKFFDNFSLGYGREEDGTYTGGGGGFGGAMAGTWSWVGSDPDRRLALAMIANSIGAYDNAQTRIDRITDDNPCIFGFEDPRTQVDRIHFVQSAAQPTRQLNTEAGLSASPSKAGWWSAHWYLEPVTGTPFYRLKNRYYSGDGPAQYLRIVNNVPVVSQTDPNTTNAHWELMPVSGYAFRLRNRANSTSYLHVQNGPLAVGSIQPSWTSANWHFCD
jgi:CubicO group peptidase (beta-lactamase class C family)